MIKLKELLSEGIYDKGIFKAVFLAGGAGSGKSFVINQLFGIPDTLNISISGMKVVNSDTEYTHLLKKYGFDPQYLDQYPEEVFQDLTVPGKSGLRTFARELTNQRKKGYLKGKLGVILDGTGSDAQSIKQRKVELEQQGYDTYMVMVTTRLEVAHQRNKQRERVLPKNIVDMTWNQSQKNKIIYKKLFGNNFIGVDNSKHLTPKEAQDKFGELIKSHINRWVNEPIKNPIAQEWVKDQLKLRSIGIK